ncbi:fungal specific transcription factor domain-containing protein [Aspergillus nidulans FGSC A4]|uniref:C6 transcription factor, putative (AFU_orthologue AFUA_5G02270) n=1 Tax=Emericella nidulans (strain FGSC A4 / ATCC 38163 / CBS 112.46 / NRRL 194 / M139) TaxID=227321 RepID=C8VE23_EMENI|nr:hypothetical protein [Aspergillus nidulans FGSC A4]CBF80323.1 TPA: C6 transcription factor, putative (AFU_orthologue; AFUA_5G02270) [Aspergillus nidulans FGSC A4]
MTYHAPSLVIIWHVLQVYSSKTFTDSASQCGFDKDRATRYAGALSRVYNQAIAGDVPGMELLLASATRFAYHLRGNVHPDKAGVRPSRLSAHIRNLFWLYYVFNQETTMRTALPPAIDYSNCDLTLPSFRMSTCVLTIHTGDHHTVPDLPPAVLGLGYGPDQRGAPLYYSELDRNLKDWKESVPSDSRPTLMRRPADAGSMASSVLQLQYHYCVAAIHQASGRCKSWTDNQDTQAQGSSLAISVAASQSLLCKFSELELYFHHYNLLFHLPYLTAAMIHLFCNILLYSREESSQSNLELIVGVPIRMGLQLRSDAPAAFRMQVKYVQDLCGEIERLAHIAISSSKQ